MRTQFWFLAASVAMLWCLAESRSLSKRQVYAEDSAIDPVAQEVDADDQNRDKRKVEESFGVKNALLGFVFNKVNSFIDSKHHWINQIEQANIQKNIQHGIPKPSDPVTSLSAVISGAIGQKLQQAGPLITVLTQKLTSGSGGLLGGSGGGGFNIGALFSGSSGGGTANAHASSGKSSSNVVRVATTPKTTTTTEEIVIFEPNKAVTLQVPDQLFGSSFNLITDLSTTLGEYAINSALRVQRVLETMRPFFWKIFGKNGVVIEANTGKPLFSDGTD